jgi:predicted polyphosphate/ATP-dependent NAD kinase
MTVRVARLGLIVNPIAGLGGSVGLKGTDRPEIVRQARALGATPQAPRRATLALQTIAAALADGVALFAAAGPMGRDEAVEAAFEPVIVAGAGGGESSARDTERAALAMAEQEVDLILFAGGDGTARDLFRALGTRVPVVGIPAGVKMHSAVYATNPRAAGELAAGYLRGGVALSEREVMDIDEEAFRRGAVSARLYGYLLVPHLPELVQGVKTGAVSSDATTLAGIAAEITERMAPKRLYILGPGTTTRAIAQALGLGKTLLGVDLIRDRMLLAADVAEAGILEALDERGATIIVTPIGGQGHFLGRGNQQISAEVIRRVGADQIVVVATMEKLASFPGGLLRIDSGDAETDRILSGHRRVVTGYRAETVCRVSA